MARANKYLEAAEAIWIQYFVAFDNQEQRTLARTLRTGFVEYQTKTSGYLTNLQESIYEWWKEVRGDKGAEASAAASGYAIAGIAGVVFAFIILLWLVRRIKRLAIWRRIGERLSLRPGGSIIAFYEQMQVILAEKGFVRELHQTPLEFANSVGLPEAVRITERYNGVRFGKHDLNNSEAEEIESWLDRLSKPK